MPAPRHRKGQRGKEAASGVKAERTWREKNAEGIISVEGLQWGAAALAFALYTNAIAFCGSVGGSLLLLLYSCTAFSCVHGRAVPSDLWVDPHLSFAWLDLLVKEEGTASSSPNVQETSPSSCSLQVH